MTRSVHVTTTAGDHEVLATCEQISALAESVLAAEVKAMRTSFEARTGAFGPEDPWFETRSRAFWDDALTAQGLATLAVRHLPEDLRSTAQRLGRAHRGLFVTRENGSEDVLLLDLWSGAELLVRPLDEAQAVTFRHLEGPMDARVVAGRSAGALFVLPGAVHHGPDALEPLDAVIRTARERGMTAADVLDALLRMELVFRASSRVKAAFAYRADSLSRPRAR